MNDLSQNPASQSDSINVKKHKILVVEDEVDAKDLFVTLLTPVPGYELFSAENGQVALDMLEKDKSFDLILLDIIMPVKDGIQTLQEIKTSPEKYGTPYVVMLTNVGSDSALESAEKLKADDYIMKIDTEPEELLKKIKALLEKRDNPQAEPAKEDVTPASAAA